MTNKETQEALDALKELRPMISSDTPDKYWFEISMVISKHMDTIRTALTEAPKVDEWQPIETAPHDGTMVLLLYPAGVCQGCFLESCGEDGKSSGKSWFAGLTWGHAAYFGDPTGWMPLPKKTYAETMCVTLTESPKKIEGIQCDDIEDVKAVLFGHPSAECTRKLEETPNSGVSDLVRLYVDYVTSETVRAAINNSAPCAEAPKVDVEKDLNWIKERVQGARDKLNKTIEEIIELETKVIQATTHYDLVKKEE